jgi:hypothetical protein
LIASRLKRRTSKALEVKVKRRRLLLVDEKPCTLFALELAALSSMVPADVVGRSTAGKEEVVRATPPDARDEEERGEECAEAANC